MKSKLIDKFIKTRFKVQREVSPYINYLRYSRKTLPTFRKRKKSDQQYTVIIEVSNSENDIADLFTNLTKQSLCFDKNIFIVVVENGISESATEEIKIWAQRYPQNIKHIYQEYTGSAVGRNIGLKHVATPWVTFINSRDFVSSNYFDLVDKLLAESINKNVMAIRCHSVIFNENKSKFKQYSVDQKQTLGPPILFRTKIILQNDLNFHEGLKSDFLDKHFEGKYLHYIHMANGETLSSPDSVYFTRIKKNKDLSSNGNLGEKDYPATLRTGYLDLINFHKAKSGTVPKDIMDTILRDLIRDIQTLIEKPEKLNSLTEEEKKDFEGNLISIFKDLSNEAILNLSDDILPHSQKIAILGKYKNFHLNDDYIAIEDYDFVNESIKLSYLSYFNELDSFCVDNEDRPPLHTKIVSTKFLNSPFSQKKIIWLKLKSHESLTGSIYSKKVPFFLDGQLLEILTGEMIQNTFQKQKLRTQKSIYQNCWLFMDRDVQADDNAEHLYRFVKNLTPNVNCFFALRKNSYDWPRLEKEGFRLIDMSSREFKKAYRDCSKIISSHADPYVVQFLGKKSLNGKKYIFLQHGVIKDDLSKWLNKRRIDCFVTSSYEEYSSIVDDYSPYIFGKKEVLLSGLPRHDHLINISTKDSSEKIVLIMPTWRMYLAGKNKKNSNERLYNKDFMSSHYAQSWKSLINNPELEKLSKQYGFKIVFFPHTNTQIYLKDFGVPSYIQTYSHTHGSIQDILLKSQLMITDYSSVAFEMAIQKKEVIYYQFDEDEFFSGAHLYKKGYFDYRNDGFGPVCTFEHQVIKSMNEYFQNGGKINPEYSKKIEKTFAHFDGKNCERIFNHILAMDIPDPKPFDIEIALERANISADHGLYELAKFRFDQILKLDPECEMAKRKLNGFSPQAL